jgi:hypothetical protein
MEGYDDGDTGYRFTFIPFLLFLSFCFLFPGVKCGPCGP